MSDTEPSPSGPSSLAPQRIQLRLKDLIGFGVGVVLFVLVVRWLAPDWDALRAQASFDWRWAALGLLGTTIASFVTAARWRLLAEVMGGTKLGFPTYFFALVWTRVLVQFLPTVAVDLVGRGMALQSAGSKRGLGHAATQVVLERMFDALLPAMALVWALGVRNEWLPVSPAISLALFCVAFLLLAVPLLRPGVRVALGLYLWLRVRLPKWRRKQVEAEAEAELIETPKVDLALAAKVAALSLVRYAAVTVQFWAIAGAIGVTMSWDQMTAAYSFVALVGMIGVTPGGLGVLEAGWAGALGWVGLGSASIGLFVLGQRLAVISYFGLLTLVSWPSAAKDKRALVAGSSSSGSRRN